MSLASAIVSNLSVEAIVSAKPSLELPTAWELWPDYAELSGPELGDFEILEEQVQDYLDWGKMDPVKIGTFRRIAGQIGSRGLVQRGRELAALGAADMVAKGDAAAAIAKIDLLSYFAEADFPQAREVISYLANRPLRWESDGTFHNSVENTVTLEAFDIFAKQEPDRALSMLAALPREQRGAHVQHYVYGRRLAGIAEAEIEKEVKAKLQD